RANRDSLCASSTSPAVTLSSPSRTRSSRAAARRAASSASRCAAARSPAGSAGAVRVVVKVGRLHRDQPCPADAASRETPGPGEAADVLPACSHGRGRVGGRHLHHGGPARDGSVTGTGGLAGGGGRGGGGFDDGGEVGEERGDAGRDRP